MGRPRVFVAAAVAIIAIVVGIAVYAHHSGGTQAEKGAVSTTAAATAQLPVVRIGTLMGGPSSLDVIVHKGLDRREGFRVKEYLFASTQNLASAIAHGDLDVAVIPAEFVAKLREEGYNITILAVDFYQNQAIVVRGNVSSIEQLRGKRVAVFEPTGTYAMFKAYMRALYNISDPASFFHIVNAPPPQIVQAFAKGEVSAAVIWEPFVSQLVAEYGGKILLSYREMWEKWSGHVGSDGVMVVYAARASWAYSHPRLVEKLLEARSLAARLWDSNESLVAHILEKYYGLSPGAAKLCWERMKLAEGLGLTARQVDNIMAVWRLAYQGGYLAEPPSAAAGPGAFWQAGR